MQKRKSQRRVLRKLNNGKVLRKLRKRADNKVGSSTKLYRDTMNLKKSIEAMIKSLENSDVSPELELVNEKVLPQIKALGMFISASDDVLEIANTKRIGAMTYTELMTVVDFQDKLSEDIAEIRTIIDENKIKIGE